MVTKAIIEREIQDVQARFPKLDSIDELNRAWKISGQIDVIDDDGGYWDTYDVAIYIPKDYPNSLPQLEEIGRKIERDEKWHNSYYCCLATPAIIYATLAGSITITSWLERFGVPFLANHVYKKKTGKYANEEFDHGSLGVLQGYFKLFETTSADEVLARLRLITTIARNDPCLCQSGKKFKYCCQLTPDRHTLGIPMQLLKADFVEISEFMRGNKKPIRPVMRKYNPKEHDK